LSSGETPLDRMRKLVALLEQLPEDIKFLMMADNQEVRREMAELAIRIIRVVPEIQRVMAIEAIKRSGLLE
jgi:hypothetical protein